MIREFKAACRGCHGGCIHILTVEDGKVTRVRPDPDGPLNNGHACTKGITIIEQMYHPDRLLRPRKRIGERGSGQWEEISWDEALDTIAQKLTSLSEESGPECIATITGTGRHMVPYLWRFTNALGSPNITSAGALICLGPRKNAGYSTSGTYGCVDYYGETQPKCIVAWGANPTTSGADGELQWHPRRCAANGTKFIVIDPQKTELAEKADLWLRLRPGTDGALAMGLINIIIEEELYDREFVNKWTYGFEKLKERARSFTAERVSRTTWIPEDQLYAAARLMAKETPMTLEWGCAIDQSFNSTNTCRAIYFLPALLGSYDVPGGFVESKHITPTKRDPIDPGSKLINEFPGRSLKPYAHPHEVLDAIRTGYPYKVRAMLSFGNNAVISLPDSERVYNSLKDLDFFVCMDVFMTPTAELADIVLPAALWPELDAVFTMPEFAEHTILCQQKVAQVGECKSDEEVFIEICSRMGKDYGAKTQKELLDTQIAEMSTRFPELTGITFDMLKERGYHTPKRRYRNYEIRGGFPTPTGKYEFYSKEIESLGGDPLPDWYEPPVTPISRPDLKRQFPYILTTGGRRQQYFISNNRQIESLRRQYPFPLVRMHPDTAEKHGLKEGDWAWIRSFNGRITQKVKLDADMDPRVINCDFGWWYPEAEDPEHGWRESNANMLTSCDNGCDSYMGSYQLRGLLCNIYKNENCRIEERFYNSKYYAEPIKPFTSASIEIDRNKCILCGECVRTCRDVQGIGVLQIATIDGQTAVIPTKGNTMYSAGCVGCGQCRAACPTQAMHIKSGIEQLKEAIADPDTMVVAQVAPSVRVGLIGQIGFGKEENAMARVVGGLKKLGIDRVVDTVFSADLTVIEEGNEFLERLTKGGKLPLLTSCCPAWVKYCEEQFPEFAANISTTRSPQQMLGAVLRKWYERPENCGGKRVFSISVMPCTAKKAEILRPESKTDGRQDVDLSITTTELEQMFIEAGIDRSNCPVGVADVPFSMGSGAGTIFGATGGVTEAVLRYLSPTLGFTDFKWIETSGVRGPEGIKSAEVTYSGGTVRIAVVSGLANAGKVMNAVKEGTASYDLIEVMACPGGCVMGGGQPADSYEIIRNREARSSALYNIDSSSIVSASQDNTQVSALYGSWLQGQEHHLLHRNFGGCEPLPGFTSPSVEMDRSKCVVCGECVRTCKEVQGIGVLKIDTTGTQTAIMPVNKEGMLASGCVGCGQCRASCFVQALHVKSDIERVMEAVNDPDTMVVAQVAPSVRAGLIGSLGFEKENAIAYVIGGLKKIGFDRVVDTVFSADLTVIEEGNEFLERLTNGGKLPLLTSCCPAWVKYCEDNRPEFAANISTTRSPQQMLGAVLRKWYERPENNGGKRVVSVSIMPCTAKKAEILRPESMTGGVQDIDYSLTTTELVEMFRTAGLNKDNCPKGEADIPFSMGSGGGTIFGATGGVTEAVLRYLSPKLGFTDFAWIEDSGVRGRAGIKKARVEYAGGSVSIAVVSGLANAKKVLDDVAAGKAHYDLIEVMACPGGCVMGGGQPVDVLNSPSNRVLRSSTLYTIDLNCDIAASQDNTQVSALYGSWLAGREHELLHRAK